MGATRTAAIIGLGLIGGSLGLALRGKGWRVVGLDRDAKAASDALSLGCVDELLGAEGQITCDVCILCVPPFFVEAIIPKIAKRLSTQAVLTDATSSKGFVVEAFEDTERADRCVGGHPMAGLEHTGNSHAKANLFHGAKWILTATRKTSPATLALVKDMITDAGAIPVEMDAETHDREIATLSHLPHAIAAALMHLGRDLRHIDAEGGSWRDCTRVGGVDPDLWTQILMSNREETAKALSTFDHKLTELRRALATGDEGGVREFLQVARTAKESLRA